MGWGKLASAAVALCLSGCVTAEPTYTADGKKGHVLSCTPALSGGIIGGIAAASTNWGTCYQKAGELCGERGFVVLERSDERGFSATVTQYGGGANTTANRSMVIQCKSTAPLPDHVAKS